jgi:hypothetical protein
LRRNTAYNVSGARFTPSISSFHLQQMVDKLFMVGPISTAGVDAVLVVTGERFQTVDDNNTAAVLGAVTGSLSAMPMHRRPWSRRARFSVARSARIGSRQ